MQADLRHALRAGSLAMLGSVYGGGCRDTQERHTLDAIEELLLLLSKH
jgi:hypothetical protein